MVEEYDELSTPVIQPLSTIAFVQPTQETLTSDQYQQQRDPPLTPNSLKPSTPRGEEQVIYIYYSTPQTIQPTNI